MTNEATVSLTNSAVPEKSREKKKEMVWMAVFAAGLLLMAVTLLTVNAYADLPSEIAGAVSKLYNDIKGIVTPVAAVSFIVALLISFLSHNQKAVDGARQTAKGILVTWIIIMLVGSIFNYADGVMSNNFVDNNIPGITQQQQSN